MTIYLHCGAHKTASTFIKTLLRKNKALLESQRISIHLDRFRDREVTVEEVLQLVQHDYQNNYKKIIISEDANIIGLMPGIFEAERQSFFHPSSVSQFTNIVDKLQQEHALKLLLCVRRQDTYLESCYKFRKVYGAKYSWEEFLNKVEKINISWLYVVDTIANHIGKENCIVIPYELLKSSQSEFMKAFFENIIPVTPNSIEIPQPNNIGASKLMMNIIDYFNSDFKNIPVVHRKKIISIIKQHETNRADKVKFINEEQRKIILDKYADDNQQLFQNYIQYLPSDYYFHNANQSKLLAV